MKLRLPQSARVLRNLSPAFDREDDVWSEMATVRVRLAPPDIRQAFLPGNDGYFPQGMMTGLAYAATYLGGCVIGDRWRVNAVDYEVKAIRGQSPLYVMLERCPFLVNAPVDQTLLTFGPTFDTTFG